MKCKYCGAKVSKGNICSNCYHKRKKVRELLELAQKIKEKEKGT